MKATALLLLGFVLCAASVFSQTESEIRDRIVGTWKLVSAVDIMKDGTTRPFPAYGPHGKGFLMYQRNGSAAIRKQVSARFDFARNHRAI
jgi:hypothetical protein